MPGSPLFNLAGTAVNSATAVTVAWPTHATNHIGLLCVQTDAETVTLTTANGFVQVTGSPQTTGTAGATNAVALAVYWARATNASMPSPVVASNGEHNQAVIISFTNCATSGNPWDLIQASLITAATTAISIASPGTTTSTDELVVGIVGGTVDVASSQSTGWAAANLTSVAKIVDVYTTTGGGGGISAAAGKLKLRGAVGTMTATLASASKQGTIVLTLISNPLSGTGSLAVKPALSGTGIRGIIGSGSLAVNPALAGTGTQALQAHGGVAVAPALAGSGQTYWPFATVRQSIINGLVSAESEGAGWNAVVEAGLSVSAVVRTSDTVVTITLPAFATYNISAQEQITATVPSSAVMSGSAITATPTFTVDPAVVGSLSVQPKLSGVGIRGIIGSGSIAVAPALAATGHETYTGSGSLAVKPALGGSGIRGNLGTGSLAVAPVLAAAGHQTESGTGSLTVKPALAGAGHQTESGTGSLAVKPAFAAAGIRGNLGTGSLAIAPAFTGTGTTGTTVTGTGSLAVKVSLSASGTYTETGTGSLAVKPKLAGTGIYTETGSGSLAIAPRFAGTGTETETASGSLTVRPTITGSGTNTPNHISYAIPGDFSLPIFAAVLSPFGGARVLSFASDSPTLALADFGAVLTPAPFKSVVEDDLVVSELDLIPA